MTTAALPLARARFRAAIALERARLRATLPARLGRTAAMVLGLAFALAAVVVRATSIGDAPIGSMMTTAARALLWAAALPLAFAAASDWRAWDRRDGVAALAASRGVSERGVSSARFLAAILETARTLAVPLALVALLHALLASSAVGIVARFGAIGVALVVALVAGATLGGVAAACASLARAAGRRVFLGLVLVPWLVAGFWGHATWSLPGALDAFLTFAFGLSGHA